MTEQKEFPNTTILAVKDMKASMAFYRDICGYEVKECWPGEEDPMWANMVMERQSLMIGISMDPEKVDAMTEDDKERAWHREASAEFRAHPAGVGAMFYIQVEDVDAHHAAVIERGGKPSTDPKSQFYGLRAFGIQDPTGYRLLFYSPITMENCQSCGMPLADAQPGDMYCDYCTDDNGKLRSYEEVLEGTIQGYFMHMQKMERAEAEVAAKEMLAKMPAWDPKACS
ncbi:MAG: VOC family protein [Planctomycetota bacterium]